MSKKLKLAKIVWPTGAIEITDFEGVQYVVKDYLNDSSVGEEWKIEIVEMEQDEFDKLPEFMGP